MNPLTRISMLRAARFGVLVLALLALAGGGTLSLALVLLRHTAGVP